MTALKLIKRYADVCAGRAHEYMQMHLTIRQTRQCTCMSKSHVSVQIQQLWIL